MGPRSIFSIGQVSDLGHIIGDRGLQANIGVRTAHPVISNCAHMLCTSLLKICAVEFLANGEIYVYLSVQTLNYVVVEAGG